MRDALDAAWGDFPTEDVGYDWLRYTGSARPDAGWVAAVLQHSTVTFIQEAYSTRSSEGYDVGVADCQYAEGRAREVHPGVRSMAVCASDGSYSDGWDASEYGRGWSDTATLPFFFYGAHGVIDSAVAGAQRGHGAHLLLVGNDGNPGRWVPETWGPTNLIGQVVGPSPIADTDLNHVHADYTGTAPEPAPAPKKKGQHMELVISPTRALTHLGGVLDVQLPDATKRTAFDIPDSAKIVLDANPGIQITHVGEATYDRLLAKLTDGVVAAPAADAVKVQAVKDAAAALAAAVSSLG